MKFIYLAIFIAIAAVTSFSQEVPKFKDDSEVPRMTIEEAKKEFDAGTAVVIDARQTSAYTDEHIKGALSFPYDSPESEFDKLPKGKTIIIYCS